MEIEPDDIGGKVTKEISLRDGQHAIYQKHTITGVEGSYNYGHHPIIEFPRTRRPLCHPYEPLYPRASLPRCL